MLIIPVLDIKDGHVVRGIGGRRAAYQPVISKLTSSTRPGNVAKAFHGQLGLTEVYVADLEAIEGAAPSLQLYNEIRASGSRLWVDAGIRDFHRAMDLAGAGIEKIVVGLETLTGPDDLAKIVRAFGSDRIAFSLDLRHGQLLGNVASWDQKTPRGIAAQAVASGVRSLIVLDVGRVGMAGGVGTEDLCEHLAHTYPQVAVIAGGGIRNMDDLLTLRRLGVTAALVASALHDGVLGPEELSRLRAC